MRSALEQAADLLGSARFPVFGGLVTDMSSATAALALAEPGSDAQLAPIRRGSAFLMLSPTVLTASPPSHV